MSSGEGFLVDSMQLWNRGGNTMPSKPQGPFPLFPLPFPLLLPIPDELKSGLDTRLGFLDITRIHTFSIKSEDIRG
jgi:hypothetical protein